MAISKKGSRKIVVDEVNYLWRVPRNRLTYSQALLTGSKAILCIESGNGQFLKITFPFNIHTSITPKLIADCIRQAKIQGWQPNEKGQFNYKHVCEVVDDW